MSEIKKEITTALETDAKEQTLENENNTSCKEEKPPNQSKSSPIEASVSNKKVQNNSNSKMTASSPLEPSATKEDANIVQDLEDEDLVLKRKYLYNHPPRNVFGSLDCKEKIIICVDHSDCMFTNQVNLEGSTNQLFNVLTSAIRHFLYSKYFINSQHEFSLVILNEDVQLIRELQNDTNEIFENLLDIWNQKSINLHDAGKEKSASSESCDKSFNACLLFKQIQNMVKLPPSSMVPPPYVVRVVFVYGRPDCPVKLLGNSQIYEEMISNPNFFFDALYIHETPKEHNKIEEVYQSICDLDKHEKSYILDCDLSDGVLSIFNCFSKLLYHPLQRQPPNFEIDLELKPLHHSN